MPRHDIHMPRLSGGGSQKVEGADGNGGVVSVVGVVSVGVGV